MRQKRKILMTFAVLIFCIGGLGSNADAALIAIEISGHVTYLQDVPAGILQNMHINIGDTITGTYTYDSSASDSEPSYSDYGVYQFSNSPMGISVNIGEFNFRTDPDNVNFAIQIRNFSGTDYYDLYSYANLPLSNGVEVYEIFWSLIDPTGVALNSDALPTLPPNLSIFQPSRNFDIFGHCSYIIRAEITSATLVPEPATLLLLSCGLWFTRCLSK